MTSCEELMQIVNVDGYCSVLLFFLQESENNMSHSAGGGGEDRQ